MLTDDTSTADLVSHARDGDERAWELLVERYSRLLWWMARRHRLPAEEAADVVQLTWLRCLEHLDTLREPRALGSWLVTTCRRESLRVLRTSARCGPVDLEGDDSTLAESLWSSVKDPVDVVMQEESGRLLQEAVSALPPRQRDVLMALSESSDGTDRYATASRRLGIPIGSMGPTRRRALDRLRADPRLRGLG
jgi:RNA polymerase sigma factor (sigma-70 family)